MARITVEDCILKIPNRFDLVMVAAQRARDISAGVEITLDRDNDKNPVVALREIAEETVDPETLRQLLIQNLQRHIEQDEPEDEDPDLMTIGAGRGVVPGEGDVPDASALEQEISGDVLTVGETAVEAGAQVVDEQEAAFSEAAAAAEMEIGTPVESEAEVPGEAKAEDAS